MTFGTKILKIQQPYICKIRNPTKETANKIIKKAEEKNQISRTKVLSIITGTVAEQY